jgi:hypothetical protein
MGTELWTAVATAVPAAVRAATVAIPAATTWGVLTEQG